MSYAAEAVRRYLGRTGAPREMGLDAAYQYEWTVLRDMLSRLEVILDDEGVPRETAERVIRCVLYGSPSPGAAEERMRREADVVKLLNERPAIPFEMPAELAAKIGVPPK
jgi:hypothetical protein